MAVRDQAARVVCDDGHPRVVHVAVVRAEHLAPACASLGSEDVPDAVTTADIDGDVHRRGRDPLATVLPEGRRHHDAAVVGGQFDEAGAWHMTGIDGVRASERARGRGGGEDGTAAPVARRSMCPPGSVVVAGKGSRTWRKGAACRRVGVSTTVAPQLGLDRSATINHEGDRAEHE